MQVSWGPLNKSLYVGTTKGRIMLIDIETEDVINYKDVHKHEIVSF